MTSKSTKTISYRPIKIKDLFGDGITPGKYAGESMLHSDAEVPIVEPEWNRDKGLISIEYAYWSTFNAYREGIKFGAALALIPLSIFIIIGFIIIK